MKTKFDPSVFNNYSKLSIFEKLFLRTCCYYPPKPRRKRTGDGIKDLKGYFEIYSSAFGDSLWKKIKNKKVLDLGCGEGGFALALAENGPSCVVGLDVYPGFKFAKIYAEKNGITNLKLVQGDIKDWAANDFDVCISHDSFEHFHEPGKTLSEMVRVTKPGGRILIKFGPTWASPWGRHMSGTIRKDRPWIHLLVPERAVMRCHSVYHNENILKTNYHELQGGLNKMTISIFKNILNKQKQIEIRAFRIFASFSARLRFLTRLPFLQDFFGSGIMVELIKAG